MKPERRISRRRFIPAGIGGASLSGLAAPAAGSPGRPVLETVDVLVAGGGPAGITRMSRFTRAPRR